MLPEELHMEIDDEEKIFYSIHNGDRTTMTKLKFDTYRCASFDGKYLYKISEQSTDRHMIYKIILQKKK